MGGEGSGMQTAPPAGLESYWSTGGKTFYYAEVEYFVTLTATQCY